MKKIILDADLRAKLFNLTHAIEFCDESGRVVGVYAPIVVTEPDAYEGLECPFSEDEIREFMKVKGGRPLADILADLEKLG